MPPDRLDPTIHPDAGREADILASEHELYTPSRETVENAIASRYLDLRAAAEKDPVAFWEERARELLDWHAPWVEALDESKAPFYRWFVGAKTNIAHNALDRHVRTWRRNKLALIWAGEKPGEQRSFSDARLSAYFNVTRAELEYAMKSGHKGAVISSSVMNSTPSRTQPSPRSPQPARPLSAMQLRPARSAGAAPLPGVWAGV